MSNQKSGYTTAEGSLIVMNVYLSIEFSSISNIYPLGLHDGVTEPVNSSISVGLGIASSRDATIFNIILHHSVRPPQRFNTRM